jgi:hypothetical protein
VSANRLALARSVCARIMALADAGDEVEVLDGELMRLEKGRACYGPLDLRSDTRDWRAEGDEEIADLGIYRALQRTSRRQAQRDAIEAGFDELRGAPDMRVKDALVAFDTSDTEQQP